MTTDRRFKTKVALVLGGSRGIGAAIVERLASEGAKVVFTYASSKPAARALVRSVKGGGGVALAMQADSGDAGAIRKVVAQTIRRLGRLDILVVNAGIMLVGKIEDYTMKDFERMVAVNIRGLFAGVQASIARMKRGGRIIAIGSNSAIRTSLAGYSVYTMTKGAVAAFVRALSLDLAPRGITINNVQPGPIATQMLGEVTEVIEAVKSYVPLGRLGTPQEIAGLVAYIASEESAFMTGVSVTMDGGFVA